MKEGKVKYNKNTKLNIKYSEATDKAASLVPEDDKCNS